MLLINRLNHLLHVCRIAANEPSFLSVHLKVQDQRDKQKLTIKALDVVLFGPPTRKNKSTPCALSLPQRLLNVFVALVCTLTNPFQLHQLF